MKKQIELSIVMPCLNEEETLLACIKDAKHFLESSEINGEIIIADNGSKDGSKDIALKAGVNLVEVNEKGYGSALNGGISSSKGQYIIMGDADQSYNFKNLMPYVEKLREGYDLVMGNRFKGGVEKGAMPFLHKYLGNPVLSFIGRLFFKIDKVKDFHCGLRGFSREAFDKMALRTTGMEFASEMVVKAALLKLKMIEVPTTLSPDGRSRAPHLNTWRDGWRHLRFLLLYSPKWLFLLPGVAAVIIGTVISSILISKPLVLFGATFDINTLLFSFLLLIIGFQAIAFYFFTRIYSTTSGLLPEDESYRKIKKIFKLEGGIVLGLLLILVGGMLSFSEVYHWYSIGFSGLNLSETLRTLFPAVFSIMTGVLVIMFSFFYSVLMLKQKK